MRSILTYGEIPISNGTDHLFGNIINEKSMEALPLDNAHFAARSEGQSSGGYCSQNLTESLIGPSPPLRSAVYIKISNLATLYRINPESCQTPPQVVSTLTVDNLNGEGKEKEPTPTASGDDAVSVRSKTDYEDEVGDARVCSSLSRHPPDTQQKIPQDNKDVSSCGSKRHNQYHQQSILYQPPPSGGFNLCLLVGHVEVVVDKLRVDRSRVRLAEVEVGDETGSVSLRARDGQIDILKPLSENGGAVVLRNCVVEFFRGRHLRLSVTKWGKITPYPDGVASTPPPPITIHEDFNISHADLSMEKIDLDNSTISSRFSTLQNQGLMPRFDNRSRCENPASALSSPSMGMNHHIKKRQHQNLHRERQDHFPQHRNNYGHGGGYNHGQMKPKRNSSHYVHSQGISYHQQNNRRSEVSPRYYHNHNNFNNGYQQGRKQPKKHKYLPHEITQQLQQLSFQEQYQPMHSYQQQHDQQHYNQYHMAEGHQLACSQTSRGSEKKADFGSSGMNANYQQILTTPYNSNMVPQTMSTEMQLMQSSNSASQQQHFIQFYPGEYSCSFDTPGQQMIDVTPPPSPGGYISQDGIASIDGSYETYTHQKHVLDWLERTPNVSESPPSANVQMNPQASSYDPSSENFTKAQVLHPSHQAQYAAYYPPFLANQFYSSQQHMYPQTVVYMPDSVPTCPDTTTHESEKDEEPYGGTEQESRRSVISEN